MYQTNGMCGFCSKKYWYFYQETSVSIRKLKISPYFQVSQYITVFDCLSMIKKMYLVKKKCFASLIIICPFPTWLKDQSVKSESVLWSYIKLERIFKTGNKHLQLKKDSIFFSLSRAKNRGWTKVNQLQKIHRMSFWVVLFKRVAFKA